MPWLLLLCLLTAALATGEAPPAAVQAGEALQRQSRIHAALRRGDWTAAAREAIGTAELAAVALYAGWPVPPGAADLAPLPRDPADLGRPESAWLGAVAPRARPAVQPGVPANRDRDRPLEEVAQAGSPPEPPPGRGLDGLSRGSVTWQVLEDGGRIEASCRDDGALRWFTRWQAEPGLNAPGRAIALHDGRLLIGEGDARLLVLEAQTGSVLLDVRPARLPILPGRTWLRPGGVVVLHPPGRDDRVGWIAGDGSETNEHLPLPARWLLTLPDGEVWIALADGNARAASAPGQWRPITLPAALLASDQPRVVEGGVAAGERLWPWRTTIAPSP
jgi:hypothetical protein